MANIAKELDYDRLLRDILLKQIDSIDNFFDKISFDNIKILMDKMISTNGSSFFLGVGKSGCIANKIAATLQSFGEKAFFLSMGNMLHGDLGVVTPNDIVCLFSKSGETKEVLDLITPLREKGAFIVAVTSSSLSSLSLVSDLHIELPIVRELDSYNLIPTTSAMCQLLFGDLLTVAIFELKQVSLVEYGKNHPSGQIGFKANGLVKDIMTHRQSCPFCLEDDVLKDQLDVIASFGFGCVLIVDGNYSLKGIFTDGDLRRALKQFGGDILNYKMKQLMKVSPKIIEENAVIGLALQEMERGRPVTVLPVVDSKDDKCIKGIIHMHALAKIGLL